MAALVGTAKAATGASIRPKIAACAALDKTLCLSKVATCRSDHALNRAFQGTFGDAPFIQLLAAVTSLSKAWP